jgi:vacuolar-type H+-ATPase subunit I/STV1
MAFGVRDFHDLVRLLGEHPEWREELRRLLLTEELLALPQVVQDLAREVRRLAELQAATDQQVARLVEAQTATDQRLARVEEAVAQLARAQTRTEERLGTLEEAVAQLTRAQTRTEERLGTLEEAVAQLTRAQTTTQDALVRLAHQVGQLSDAVGFTLEQLARELAPAYLAERYGIRVASLERRFFTVDGEEVEVDLFGEGTRDAEKVVVLGEVRSRIYGRDVEALARRIRRLAPQLPGTPVGTLFGFVVHPSAREAADRTGILVIATLGR